MLTTIEKAITERIVNCAIEDGYKVGAVADCSADVMPCTDTAKILKGAFSYDCVDLLLWSQDGLHEYFIALDFFNDKLEIVTDYSTGLEGFISSLDFNKLEINLGSI